MEQACHVLCNVTIAFQTFSGFFLTRLHPDFITMYKSGPSREKNCTFLRTNYSLPSLMNSQISEAKLLCLSCAELACRIKFRQDQFLL